MDDISVLLVQLEDQPSLKQKESANAKGMVNPRLSVWTLTPNRHFQQTGVFRWDSAWC